jgi:hypothetical protein
LFGNQKLEWVYDLSQLTKAPELSKEGLIFSIKSHEKKLFGSRETIVKTIYVKDEGALKVYFMMLNIFKVVVTWRP